MYKLVKVPADKTTYDIVMADVIVGRSVHVGRATWDTKIGVYEYSAKTHTASIEGCIRKVVVQNSYTRLHRVK